MTPSRRRDPTGCACSAPTARARRARPPARREPASPSAPAAGDLALVSQSGTVAAAIVEWAARRGGRVLGGDVAGPAPATSTSPTASTISPATAAPARSCSASTWCRTPASSCRRRGRRRAPSRWWCCAPAATPRGRAGRRDPYRRAGPARRGLRGRVPAGGPARAWTTSTRCSRPPRRWARQRPFPGKRLAILTNGGGIGGCSPPTGSPTGGGIAGATRPSGWSAATRSISASTPSRALRRAPSRRCWPTTANDAVLVIHVPDRPLRRRRGGRRRSPTR